jgi:hypothetical protein
MRFRWRLDTSASIALPAKNRRQGEVTAMIAQKSTWLCAKAIAAMTFTRATASTFAASDAQADARGAEVAIPGERP